MPIDELRKRSIYLAGLLKREEVVKEEISEKNPELFDRLLKFMEEERMIIVSDGKVKLRSSGEAMSLLICSIAWPMIDTYYAVLIYSLTLVKKRN
jgi:hypothetical protein